MEKREIPPDVLQFIAREIDTVPHLEALLLLFENSAEHWTVERAAARLYVAPDRARDILADLERRKLVRLVPGAARAEYAYDPSRDDTGPLMDRVASTYRRQLSAVAAFIHSKASRSVREFARAFELKKDR
ncbi:MAG TPA: hypothetical protein VJL86_03535 [Steroidobacteraceae bacterium]|nr:hypothetical protein [Steroidobacteraceae bacterium]